MFPTREIWLASKVVAHVTLAEEVRVDSGAVLFRWGVTEKDALSDPHGLLEGVRSLARPDKATGVQTFYKHYGPFNFTAGVSAPGRVWRRSLVTPGKGSDEFLGQERLDWVLFLAERVSFLYEVGRALNLRGTFSRKAARLREIWPLPEEITSTFHGAAAINFPVLPEWKQIAHGDADVIKRARDYALSEVSGFIAGPGRPSLSIELVFARGQQGQQMLKPRTLCPTLFQAVGLALVWHFQQGFEVRPCKCGCGRWLQRSTGPGRPREFYEDKCKWRFAKAG